MTRSSCVCDMGWTGPECEAELGGCVSTPCAHGGTCHPQPSGYNCTCPTGYIGEALPKPHTPWGWPPLNQGQDQWRCVSKGSGSSWLPPTRTGLGLQGTQVIYAGGGWVGEHRDADEKRKGRRSEEKRRVPCLRPHPLPQGPTCSEEVTACHSGPCLNGGSCSPIPGGYSCSCPPSHTGRHCQTSTDSCASGECLPCPGVGPKEDGGPTQCVFVSYFKKTTTKTGYRELVFWGWGCPVCGVTEVTGK